MGFDFVISIGSGLKWIKVVIGGFRWETVRLKRDSEVVLNIAWMLKAG